LSTLVILSLRGVSSLHSNRLSPTCFELAQERF
jgi:hypothetical protein